jgi:hypothetical protein
VVTPESVERTAKGMEITGKKPTAARGGSPIAVPELGELALRFYAKNLEK